MRSTVNQVSNGKGTITLRVEIQRIKPRLKLVETTVYIADNKVTANAVYFEALHYHSGVAAGLAALYSRATFGITNDLFAYSVCRTSIALVARVR